MIKEQRIASPNRGVLPVLHGCGGRCENNRQEEDQEDAGLEAGLRRREGSHKAARRLVGVHLPGLRLVVGQGRLVRIPQGTLGEQE